jgi:hypothetical protein
MTVACVAWTNQTDRAVDLAVSVDGVSRQFTGRLPQRPWTAPARYLVNTVETLLWLLRVRPNALVVQNPPIVAPLVCWLYARIARIPLVLDSHPRSFGAKQSRVWKLFVPLHRWLAARSAAVLVTTEGFAELVGEWGGTGIVVHEPPEQANVQPTDPANAVPGRVLYINVFASDEPLKPVLDAAREVPGVQVRITGDPSKAPSGACADAPDNVSFVGFLRREAFGDEVSSASAIIALTTEPTSVMRSGYEAVYARRPLIISDWPVSREVFPAALHVSNSAPSIAVALRAVQQQGEQLLGEVDAARDDQIARWDRQLGNLRAALGVGT